VPPPEPTLAEKIAAAIAGNMDKVVKCTNVSQEIVQSAGNYYLIRNGKKEVLSELDYAYLGYPNINEMPCYMLDNIPDGPEYLPPEDENGIISGEYYRILAKSVPGVLYNSGSAVSMSNTTLDNPKQHWQVVRVGNGVYTLKSKVSQDYMYSDTTTGDQIALALAPIPGSSIFYITKTAEGQSLKGDHLSMSVVPRDNAYSLVDGTHQLLAFERV
jgi:hypothetical protein